MSMPIDKLVSSPWKLLRRADGSHSLEIGDACGKGFHACFDVSNDPVCALLLANAGNLFRRVGELLQVVSQMPPEQFQLIAKEYARADSVFRNLQQYSDSLQEKHRE